SKMTAAILWILWGLFVLRVLGQAAVAAFQVSYLPPMKEWYSGLVPYPILLPTQIALVAVMAWIAADLSRQAGFFFIPRPLFGRGVVWFGCLYAAAMAFRYVVQMARHPERRWFGGTIPIVFHFVLAAFVITFGLHHARGGWHPSAAVSDRDVGMASAATADLAPAFIS
ncbi:MAG: hypothetical protein WD036_06705, partial [Bauldia sp.]